MGTLETHHERARFGRRAYLTGWLVMEGDTSRFGARQSELVDRLEGEAAISGVTMSAFPLMEESGADVKLWR